MTLNMSGTQHDHRPTAMILAFIAAAALLFTVVSKRWLTMREGDIGFGLTHFSMCHDGTCDSKSNAEVVTQIRRNATDFDGKDPTKSGFVPLGWIALLSTALAALALAGAAGVFASKRKASLPGSLPGLALWLLFVSLLVAMIFVARKPGGREFGVGYTFWIFGVANVLGIVAAQILARRPPGPLPDDLPL